VFFCKFCNVFIKEKKQWRTIPTVTILCLRKNVTLYTCILSMTSSYFANFWQKHASMNLIKNIVHGPPHLNSITAVLYVFCYELAKLDDIWLRYLSLFIGELHGGALPYWRLDAKRPHLLPSSKLCGPRSSRTEVITNMKRVAFFWDTMYMQNCSLNISSHFLIPLSDSSLICTVLAQWLLISDTRPIIAFTFNILTFNI